MKFAPRSSFFGIPCWVSGVVWFPPTLVLVLLFNRGSRGLRKEWLVILTVGNIFTGHLWSIDLVVINASTVIYVTLYAANYALTALMIIGNRKDDVMRGYVHGTLTGAIVGLLFGPYGVAAAGIGGGIFGALRKYVMPIQRRPTALPQPEVVREAMARCRTDFWAGNKGRLWL